MLDKSHLELVEDVLKETTFDLMDWYELGRKLMKASGPYGAERIDYIKRASSYGNNSLKLKECLKSWLSPDITGSFFLIYDEPHPTLDELADALRSIGYNEAAEYISKTCKLIIGVSLSEPHIIGLSAYAWARAISSLVVILSFILCVNYPRRPTSLPYIYIILL